MDIGKEKEETKIYEPAVSPVPKKDPATPATPTPKPEKVPAKG